MTKLVRDLVPQIILKSGRIPVFRIAELAIMYILLVNEELKEEKKEARI